MARNSSGIVIFSGGSAANSLVDVFESVRLSKGCPISYIIPISDNGGSSSELIRVFGGPGIGDVRSRLVRLIPQEPPSEEREAIRQLLSGRLHSTDGKEARHGWADIVDGTSDLWRGVSSAKKELIRSFFNLINLEILKRSRPPVSTFDFRSASIGNLFLTGARLFSGSFESSVYLLSAICGIPDESIRVIPSINSNFSHHIAAELEDGSVINGQNSISHPSTSAVRHPREQHEHAIAIVSAHHGSVSASADHHDERRPRTLSLPHALGLGMDDEQEHDAEDANPPFTIAPLRANNITFTKAAHELEDLPSRISRIHYTNSFGQEILPPANPRALTAIQHAQSIIYSIGSLYTSIAPNLVLRGIGEAMRKSSARIKVLILNGSLDREVGPQSTSRPFTALDFIHAIVKAGEQSRGLVWNAEAEAVHTEELATVHTASPSFQIRPVLNRAKSDALGARRDAHEVYAKYLPSPLLASAMPSRTQSPSASPERQVSALPLPSRAPRSSSHPNPIYQTYVTHIIHLPNADGVPFVDADVLMKLCGVRCIKVYGRRNNSGPGMLYDAKALQGAIEAILGGKNYSGSSYPQMSIDNGTPRFIERERGRRNTVDQ